MDKERYRELMSLFQKFEAKDKSVDVKGLVKFVDYYLGGLSPKT